MHPEMGAFFNARLTAVCSQARGRSEFAGLACLWRYALCTYPCFFWALKTNEQSESAHRRGKEAMLGTKHSGVILANLL